LDLLSKLLCKIALFERESSESAHKKAFVFLFGRCFASIWMINKINQKRKKERRRRSLAISSELIKSAKAVEKGNKEQGETGKSNWNGGRR
jgi:hypothetical protein